MTPQEAAKQFYWIKTFAAEKVIELYCDHQMLSTLRTCEAKFFMEHTLNIRPHGHKAWSLVFGAWMHSCFEYFYNHFRDNDNKPPLVDDFLKKGKEMWEFYKLEAYKDEEKYQKVKGLDGALSLLVMYYAYYHTLRVRVIDTEITFGFEKEVFLGEFKTFLPTRRVVLKTEPPLELTQYESEWWTVKCYLTGRIDLLIDNGHKIGVVDHKHTMAFRGDEHLKFNPHDGITGYIVAINSLMERIFPEYFRQGRRCTSGWIYHISGTMPIPRDKSKTPVRFKATPIDKTLEQLEEYKLRQLTTFRRLTSILFTGETPQWQTNACGNIFMQPCEYRPIHEAPSSEWVNIVQSHYNTVLPWNPLTPEQSHIIRDKVLDAATLGVTSSDDTQDG